MTLMEGSETLKKLCLAFKGPLDQQKWYRYKEISLSDDLQQDK